MPLRAPHRSCVPRISRTLAATGTPDRRTRVAFTLVRLTPGGTGTPNDTRSPPAKVRVRWTVTFSRNGAALARPAPSLFSLDPALTHPINGDGGDGGAESGPETI